MSECQTIKGSMASNSRSELNNSKAFVYGLQHVFGMCAAILAVPIMIGNEVNVTSSEMMILISSTLFVSGIATLIQSIGFKEFIGVRMPLMLGASSNPTSTMLVIAASSAASSEKGLSIIFTSTILAGLFCFLMAPLFSKLLKFFPKIVTGTIITLMGIYLIPIAVRWCAGGVPTSPDYRSLGNIMLAFSVLLIIVALNKWGGKTLGSMSILIGIVLGTIISMILGKFDFNMVNSAGILSVPKPFFFGTLEFDMSAIISMIVVMFIMMIASTGNTIAIHDIFGEQVTQKKVTRALRADGLSCMIAGVFNTFPQAPCAQNLGISSMIGINGTKITTFAGVILIVLGIVPKFAALIASIPYPVLGGAGIVMFGMIISAGINNIKQVEFDGTKNGLIFCVSIAVSMIPIIVPDFYANFPEGIIQIVLSSGITSGSICAISLNLLFNNK
ncbi:MAG: nucleobase:cation symporter-2 family protein [Peptostreptococcaceae bacterium]